MSRRGRLLDAVLLSPRGIALCCAVLVLLLGLNALVFYNNTQTLLDQERWVTHTHEVLSALNASTGALASAESAQRGYILTGNDAYLRDYTAAEGAVGPALTHLGRLVSDNPSQERRVAQVRALIRQKLADLAQTVALRRSGQTAQALAIVLADRGKAVTDAIGAQFSTMTNTELALLRLRDRRAHDAAGSAKATLAIAIAADAALLAGALLAIGGAFARRSRLAEERGRLLVQARQARAEAEAAVRARDDFLSLAAHELRTPLTSLLGNVQLLQARGDRLAPREQRLVAAVARGTARLRTLAEYLLDASRLDERGLDLDLEPLDLAALARQAVAEVAETVPGHTLRVDAAEGPIAVAGDRVRLEQVVHNLLANAVKYSPEGGEIVVTVARADDRARLTIGDAGIGIPADALPHLFDRFYRAPNASPYTYSGLGLGLYVVREVVSGHGGTVTVESTEGAGSTFIVELPALPADAAPPTIGAPSDSAPANAAPDSAPDAPETPVASTDPSRNP